MTAERTSPRATGHHYIAPPTPAELAAQLGVPVERICKLDGNESPFGAPPAARAALRQLADPGCDLLGASRYPDPQARDLRDALAGYGGVPAERIVVGNGSDELLRMLSELLLRPGDEIVVSEPTFSVYGIEARFNGAAVRDAGTDDDFHVDPDALVATMRPNTRIVFLCSPNNPTGGALPRVTLDAVLARAEALSGDGHEGPLVVLDEAYYEFGALAGDPDSWTAAPLVTERGRVVVLRTFSKLFGLAGLRVGYALCPTHIVDLLRGRKQPYNVNIAGLLAARAALGEMDWLRPRARLLINERARVSATLQALPRLRVFPSSANFVLVALGERGDSAPRDALYEALLRQGILVRRLSGDRLANTLRITVGSPEENDRLLTAVARELDQRGDPPLQTGTPAVQRMTGGTA